ncbi:MAG: hypothetical protein Q7R95_04855 [bacterium]|nr:hypothetical protein [bacterium]
MLLAAFVFRLAMTPKIYNGDLLSQADWGEYVAYRGPLNLYAHNVWVFYWPNHPPLTNLYYGFCFDVFKQISLRLHQSVLVFNKIGLNYGLYFDFVKSFDLRVSPGVPFSLGYMLCLKLFPVIADILIGLIIYLLAVKNNKNGYKYLLLYLLLPFSWYISALWGQTDQLAFLFVFVAFLLVLKHPFWSIILFFVGGSIKPTSVFLIPLYLFILYRTKPKFIYIFFGLLICFLLNYFIFIAFTDEGYIKFTFERLLPRLFDKPLRLTTNSFNFWHIFVLQKNVASDVNIFIFSGKVWAMILLTALNIFTFVKIKLNNIKSIVFGMFVISFGSWLFATEMLDRYAFAGIASGLVLSIYYPKILKYWLMLSFIFWLNLFRGWWYPSQLHLLQELLEWKNYSAGLILGLINIMIYFKIVWVIINDKND